MEDKPYLYKILAYYPNVISDPMICWQPHYAQALNHAIDLVQTGNHTIISVITPDNLEIIRFWGQLKGMP